MPKVAKLFMNGNSQAVRLPYDCRFEGNEVYIEKHADYLVIRPVKKLSAEWLADFLARYEPIPDDFLQDISDEPPQRREWLLDDLVE